MLPGLAVFAVLVVGYLIRASSLARLRRGDHRASGAFVMSTLVVSAAALGVAVWTAVRMPVVGIPATVAVLVVAGVWLRQANAGAQIVAGGRGPRGLLDRTVSATSGAIRIAAAAVAGAGFVGLVALVVYLLLRTRF